MKQIIIILTMTFGFTLGNLVAFKGNEAAKTSYESFLKDIKKWQNQNKVDDISDFQKEAKKLSISTDPNLKLHN
jgi:predicted negative regulator of RcsB-dependent stress response